MFGKSFLRTAGALPGDMVVVELWPDPDPEHVELPEELTEVLAQDEAAARLFHALTAGRRRSLAYHVSSAKRPETRIRRSLELAKRLRNGTLFTTTRPDH